MCEWLFRTFSLVRNTEADSRPNVLAQRISAHTGTLYVQPHRVQNVLLMVQQQVSLGNGAHPNVLSGTYLLQRSRRIVRRNNIQHRTNPIHNTTETERHATLVEQQTRFPHKVRKLYEVGFRARPLQSLGGLAVQQLGKIGYNHCLNPVYIFARPTAVANLRLFK